MPWVQPLGGLLDLLGRGDLVVTRKVEWGNLLMGFEQESRYEILDPRTMQVPPCSFFCLLPPGPIC